MMYQTPLVERSSRMGGGGGWLVGIFVCQGSGLPCIFFNHLRVRTFHGMECLELALSRSENCRHIIFYHDGVIGEELNRPRSATWSSLT